MRLKNFIKKILNETHSAKIDLVAHTASGKICYDVPAERSIGSKVAHYVHVAGLPMKLPVRKNAELHTMNIYSSDDMILRKGKDIPGAVNVQFKEYDHLQVASNEKTFEAIFSFLAGYGPDVLIL